MHTPSSIQDVLQRVAFFLLAGFSMGFRRSHSSEFHSSARTAPASPPPEVFTYFPVERQKEAVGQAMPSNSENFPSSEPVPNAGFGEAICVNLPSFKRSISVFPTPPPPSSAP